MFPKIILLSGVVLFVVIAGGGVFWYEKGHVDTSGWKTYRDDVNGFEFRYPGKCEVKAEPSSDDYIASVRVYKVHDKTRENGWTGVFWVGVSREKNLAEDTLEGFWVFVDWHIANVYYPNGEAGNSEAIILRHGDVYFSFLDHREVHRDILRTFRFLR